VHSPALKRGFIVTNANCSVTALTVPLAALEKAFGPLDTIMVTTMQAISGAGYPGVPSLDIYDNVVPLIGGEEEKMEWEALKILGELEGIDARGQLIGDAEAVKFDIRAKNPLKVSAACNRVAVIEGHTECVSVRFAKHPPPSPAQVEEALAAYVSPVDGLPSAPSHAIHLFQNAVQPDRPQPRLDRDLERGAGVCVGRVRECPVLDIKFVVMGNNVSIGAAMSSILNAEWAVQNGLIVPLD
jgi:aspartate-semialdehyde dehydrogenase